MRKGAGAIAIFLAAGLVSSAGSAQTSGQLVRQSSGLQIELSVNNSIAEPRRQWLKNLELALNPMVDGGGGLADFQTAMCSEGALALCPYVKFSQTLGTKVYTASGLEYAAPPPKSLNVGARIKW
jgi:hypothetical protein